MSHVHSAFRTPSGGSPDNSHDRAGARNLVSRKPFDPSGIRLGSPSVTSRGMGDAEMKQIAAWMDRVVGSPDEATATAVAGEVRELTRKFPAPGISS